MDRKELIIQEYLSGGISLCALQRKHGFHRRSITRWLVARFGFVPKGTISNESGRLLEMEKPSEPLPNEIAELQKQLEKERLRNKLLNTMIDIAEKELKISIRKKSGTKQSSR